MVLIFKKLNYLATLLFLSLILISTIVSAGPNDNIYLHDSLEIEINVSGQFELDTSSDDATYEEFIAKLLLYPSNNYEQELLYFQSKGIIENETVVFNWTDQELGNKDFSYLAMIETSYLRNEIDEKITFPIENIENYLSYEENLLEYLEETESIDFSDPSIVAQANDLASGKDDLFEVVFTLASWVEENIAYDLNSLTADSSQTSSWVLENRQGVCDEMTSLFIAMSRSLGIPARFVTGITYTNSELFDEPWQAHGWAEVYFPEYGWVSFDPTFGEYGYIDVTHLKLKDSSDPTESSILYQWFGKDIELATSDLGFQTQIIDYGGIIDDEFLLEMEHLEEMVNIGSFNLIKGAIKNDNDYYAATTVSLAVPEEIEIISSSKQTILLEPKELKEVYWIIKVSDDLDNGYIYEFPYLIYTEKNVSLQDSFEVKTGEINYNYNEIKELLPRERKGTYSRKIILDCDYKDSTTLGQEVKVSCQIENKGNSQLENLEFCIDDTCEIINLGISQEYILSENFSFDSSGWQSVFVKVNNEEVSKSEYLNIEVFDEATINFNYSVSENITYAENFIITLNLDSDSFSIPQNVTAKIKIKNVENTWEISKLIEEENIILPLSSSRLAKENDFPIEITWSDNQNETYILEENVYVQVNSGGIVDKIVMFFNRILF